MDSVAINPTANLASADVRQEYSFFNANHDRFLAAFRAPEPETSLITQPENAVRLYADTGLALFRHPSSSGSPISKADIRWTWFVAGE